MARLNLLSARQVETLKKPGRHADGGGLMLQITKSGSRSWIFRYRWGSGRREMGLGSANVVGLAQARNLAHEARQTLQQARSGNGPDPLESRRAKKEAEKASKRAEEVARITFGQVADEHVAAMKPSWANEKHRLQWDYSLETLAAELRPLPVAEVDTAAVLSVLEPLWGKTPETASRLRGRIEAVLNRAKANGLRTGENPAAWKGHLELLLPRRQKLTRGHHAALPYEDLPAFMVKLRKLDSLSALCLEFTILTAARTGEAIGAMWDEIELGKKVWTIPARRMKAKVEHRIPLSLRAVEILETLQKIRQGPYVFPGVSPERHLSNMGMAMLLRDLKPGVTVHGFRSSFRDWAGEQTSFPHEVCEQALAHRISDKAEAAYRRRDMLNKRAKLMDAWGKYVGSKVDLSGKKIGQRKT